MPFRVGAWPMLSLSNPDHLEEVLVRQQAKFAKHSYFWRQVAALFGNGLLTSEGALWRRQQRLVAPAFAGEQLLAYGNDIVRLTEQMLGRWRSGEIRNLHTDMTVLMLAIATKTLFDAELEEEVAEIDRANRDVMGEIAARMTRPVLIPDWLPLPGHIRYRRGLRRFEKILERMILAHQSGGLNGKDCLSKLMLARDEHGEPMSDAQLRDEALTLLIAGHDSAAVSLSWAGYLLGQHADIHAQVTSEVRRVLGDRPATVDDLPQLRITASVVDEARRLYPPVWGIGREALTDCEIGGHRVRAGTTIVMSQWVIQRDPRWYESPEAFRPSRWTDDFRRTLPRFAYFPFGGGPRVCIGQRFATMEAVLILATIIQRFGLAWQPDCNVALQPGITLQPKGGIWTRVTQQAG